MIMGVISSLNYLGLKIPNLRADLAQWVQTRDLRARFSLQDMLSLARRMVFKLERAANI